MRPTKDHFVARLAGVVDRNAAERLANTKLYVLRERLPQPDEPDEFYHADLIGLAVVDRAGKPLGTVVAVHNFGAGDLIEVRQAEGGRRSCFRSMPRRADVDLAAGRLVVDRRPSATTCGARAF